MSCDSVIAEKFVGCSQYQIDVDPSRLDIPAIHRFLSGSAPWSLGIPLETLRRAIENSLVFGVYRDGRQIGFARIITDRATFAYLTDVFILPDERGAGIGRWLLEAMLADPQLRGLRRWLLVTRDARNFYAQLGFDDLVPGFAYLERFDPDVYRREPVPTAGAGAMLG